jgi:hypothetical protein
MYNPDYRRMRGWLFKFCTLNRSHPWTRFADTPNPVLPLTLGAFPGAVGTAAGFVPGGEDRDVSGTEF